jgi:Lanthionine synthetase C-like protein
MIYEAARHEALTGSSWNEATSREYIQRIAADANATFSRCDLWPTHPLEEARPGTRFYNLYFGAGGVVWALNHLRRIGAIVDHPDFQEGIPELREANRAQIEGGGRWRSHGADGLLIGDAGLLLVAGRLAGLNTVSDQLGAAVDNNQDNPVREFMFGSPGTATLSLALFEETGDDIWASRFRRDIRLLWDRLETCEGADCLIWEQNLQGHKATHLGAVHGFAGNAFPALRGRHLLPENEQKQWLDCIARTLRATAVREGELINWPQSVGKHRPGRTAMLMQHCHGAPGIVNTMATFPGSAIDDLLTAAGETIWQAGPLKKGSCICHGTAGNGFAFLKLFKRTGREMWLDRARQFAAHAIGQCEVAKQQYGQYRYTLWTGDLGLAIFLSKCIEGDDLFPTEDFF